MTCLWYTNSDLLVKLAAFVCHDECSLPKVKVKVKQGSWHMKVASFQPHAPGIFTPPHPRKYFCYRQRRPQDYSVVRGIMSMKISSDSIGDRTQNLRAFNTAPQPAASPRAVLAFQMFTNWYGVTFQVT